MSPELNIYDEQWPIWTYQEQLPPAKFVLRRRRPARTGDGLDGVRRLHHLGLVRVASSLLFSSVRVHDYSTIDRSVILPGVRVGERCVIRNAIIDEGTDVPDGTQIGVDRRADAERFHITEDGVVLVTAAMLRAAQRPG